MGRVRSGGLVDLAKGSGLSPACSEKPSPLSSPKSSSTSSLADLMTRSGLRRTERV